MPYNNHKNNSSFGTAGRSSKKKRGGGGGRKKRCDGMKKQQNESGDLEQDDYDRAASPPVASEQNLDNSAAADPSCDNDIAISEKEIQAGGDVDDEVGQQPPGTADYLPTCIDNIVEESASKDVIAKNDEAPADVGEKIDTPAAAGELNEFLIHDNSATAEQPPPPRVESENLCEFPTQSIVGNGDTAAELQKKDGELDSTVRAHSSSPAPATPEAAALSSSTSEVVCTVAQSPENKNSNGNNRWSIESILLNNDDDSSTDKPIEQNKGDTVDEHHQSPETIEGSTAAATESDGGSVELQPINYGPTGFQIDGRVEEEEEEQQQSINGNSSIAEGTNNCSASVESIASLPMGAEVGSRASNSDLLGGGGGTPLSKSNSFSSNSSDNTSSTIIFTGHTGIGQLKEWDCMDAPTKSRSQSPIMECVAGIDPKSLRELSLQFLLTLPYGHSIIEELAQVSERLKDLVLQTETMNHLEHVLKAVPPPAPKPVVAPPPVPPPVSAGPPPPVPPRKPPGNEIKLDQIRNHLEGDNNSRLLSIIRDAVTTTSTRPTTTINDITSAIDCAAHHGTSGAIKSALEDLDNSLISLSSLNGGTNQANESKANSIGQPEPLRSKLGQLGETPTLITVSESRQQRVQGAGGGGGGTAPPDKSLLAELKEKLFINSVQGDGGTHVKNTPPSQADEVTNNNCRFDDSHPPKDQVRAISTISSAHSYSLSEVLHHSHVTRPLTKEDKFCRGLVTNGTFRAPTLFEEEEEPQRDSSRPPTYEEQAHQRLRQLNDMHKKRSSYIEQQRTPKHGEPPLVPEPPPRRRSLPYELHERQLQYLQEMERGLNGSLGGPPSGGISVFGSRALQDQLSEAEAFRKQMHDEWMTRIAERDQRRFSKVIKLTNPVIPEEFDASAKHPASSTVSMEDEFLKRVQQRRQKLHLPSDSDWESGAESTPVPKAAAPAELAAKAPKVVHIPIRVIDGEKVTEVNNLPKHLQEFAESYAECPSTPAVNVGSGGVVVGGGGGGVVRGINPSFKAVAPQAGKWSPKSSEGDDIWRVVDESCRNGHLLQQQQQHDNRPVSPVWTPRSAQCSPVASRKQFRPVPFQSPQLERKFTRLNDGDSGPQAPPPWEQPGFDKLPPPVHPHHHHHHPPNDSKPASSVRRLAQSFSAPKLNTLGGADGHSEPYSKHSRSYVCPPTRSLEGDPPPVQQQQWADDKYATAPPNRDPVTVNRGGYDPVRDMANYATREIPGVGPVTKEGMPISLRSEAKDHNQSHWYKQVYNTIHKPHGDDGFLTVRYKTRRGGATHKANGYMSEPEGYESDYTYNSDAYSGITPQKPPGSYKMNPGKIEDYQPGQYQEPEKPRSTSTRPARTAYTQGNLSRALKEQGYESDNSFIVRKKGPLVNAPSPEYQKQAYLQVQAGGEPPLQGFRKQLSAQPRENSPDPSPISFDIMDLVTVDDGRTYSMPANSSRDIICYPITNVTRPLNMFGEFPKSKAFIPPTPPVRDSSISSYFFNDMLLMATSSEMPKVNIVEPRTIATAPKRPATIAGNCAKDQKNIVNSSKLQAICGKATKAIACKRVSRRGVSEPRRSTPSPVAFGRSISKERTFAEEKKKLEQVSPQCKKAVNLTTRILKKGEYKSSEDLRKAIHRTVLGKKLPEPPMQMAQKDCVVTYQKKGDSHKWTSLTTASQRQTIDSQKKCSSRNVEYKQITRCDRTNSISSLARTNSTFSIDSTSKPCDPLKCKFFGSKQIVKLGAFIASKPGEKPVKGEKKVKETVKSTSPKTIKGKCHPVSTYLSTRRPVSTSKFKMVDRHRSLSPTRTAEAYTALHRSKFQHREVMAAPLKKPGLAPSERSKSQPPKMVEIMMPDEPTVIHVKPNLTPSLITYNSLPRVSRELKSVIHMRQISGAVFRTKSEGPSVKQAEELQMDHRWSVSTPALNVIEKHSDVCHYRNSDRFQELNQFYSNLERVGHLQKVTSQSDLRPIRKREEVIDYDLWKKIRMREKAQKELDFLVHQLKSNQKEKKIHFERDVDSIRWNGEADAGLRHKSMSVENLKDFFQEKGLFAEKPPMEAPDNAQPMSVTQAVDSYESHLGLSPKLISTLSPDQVLKLKCQLKQIYNGETTSNEGKEKKPNLLPKRSLSLGPPRPPPLLDVPPPTNRVPTKFHTVTSITHLSENEKKHLTQSICSEIKEAVEQRRRHKSLDSTRSSDTTSLSTAVDVDCLKPKDIQSKIHYFEKKPLELPGTTIYHARDATSSSSDEEVTSSVPAQVERPHVDQDLMSRRSHSFSDLKEIFGERSDSFKCRSVSPSVRYAVVVDRAETSPSSSSLFVKPVMAADSSENCATTDVDQRKPIISSNRAKIDRDVSWMAHKYENISARGRCRKRRTISASSLIKQQDGLVLMPHIDIISKTASLQRASRVCSPAPPAKKTGEVEKIRNFFESKNKSSLLGEMFTSEPDISKLRDVSVYLSGSWVAHQYPKKEDNFLSLRKVDSAKHRGLKKEKVRSISISPSRKMGILKQCIFPYKIFDDEKLASLPFPLTSGSLAGRRCTGTEKDAEKVLRKHKDQRCDIIEDENAAEATAAVPPPPPPVKAMKMHALDDVYNNKYDDDTSRQYVEGNVNIHYKSPIRQEFKGIIPEDELAEQQAEAMRAIYEQERRRKQWQELEDLKNRRHTDNFTASQKSPISVHRFDDFVGVEGSAPKPKITTPPLAKAKALYDFVGQSSRELTFNQGDIITIHRKIDANWYEGEHNAFCGLFPVDYVEIISGAPAPAARAKPTEGLARAKYTFVAQSGIELSLNKGELVALTRQVDENWFEGRIANRKGIIPISYCEVITPIGKRFEHPSSMVTSKREEMFIECAPEREMKTSKTEILHVDTSSEPLMYRAVFKYVPQNPDELELFEGDSVMVLEKCDDGWFVGTSERTGCFGTFPGNYVQRI